MRQFLRNVIMLMALVLAGQAFAQVFSGSENQVQEKNAVSTQALATLAPEQCFSAGSAVTFLKVCITNNGNISWFESPAGKVHLQYREGYAVCSGAVEGPSSVVHGFDANIAAAGWDNSTVSQPNGAGTFPLIITRKSLDAVIQLKQTFTLSTTERGVNVRIDVKNISASVLNTVVLSRYFDGDIDNSSTNAYDSTYGSVWARGSASALTLTAASSGIQVIADVYDYAQWDPNGSFSQYARGCGQQEAYTWGVQHDFVGGLTLYFSTLNPGQTKTATVLYRRF
jgi:hypothetical protein